MLHVTFDNFKTIQKYTFVVSIRC